jgi:hypothetical protein
MAQSSNVNHKTMVYVLKCIDRDTSEEFFRIEFRGCPEWIEELVNLYYFAM